MARQIRIEYPGAVYHVTSKGNDRQAVYETKADRFRFLNSLEQGCKRYQWIVYAYCLMDNHYHLLIETRESSLSKGMRHLNGVYTQWDNNGSASTTFLTAIKDLTPQSFLCQRHQPSGCTLTYLN